ncbi:uncharacterized protein LOC142176052 [Nicotiana tabacum]|uniref:Uncharacterized protein LOC142176052 n=1 Tax=Nicotiana tabacum TaxID=4097 RepID=A0AC58TPS9_TOBAC
MGPAGRDSRSKHENPRYGSRSRDRDAGSSSKFGKERDTRDSIVNTKAKIGDYSFSVSTSELVAVLRSSSVNIILLRVVNEMQFDDKMVPKARTLTGFDNSSVVTKEEILLATFAKVVKDTKFQVIDTDMAYNIILDRPWIHEMDDVPSTLHQVIKFPSQWGIRQIHGDQQASRSINSVADSSIKNDVADKN